MGLINLLFSVSGRINRAKYWLAVVFWTVVCVVSILVLVIVFAQDIGRFSTADSAEAMRLVLSYGAVIILFIAIWALVELGFLRGTIGANQYGPDPLAPQMASH